MLLKNFPVAIEPGADILEVQLEPDTVTPGAKNAGSWRHLHRLAVTPDTFPFPVDALSVHFFGPVEEPEDCSFVLIYDANGVWRYIATRDTESSPWEHTPVPEEVVGRAIKLPSVRLVFDDPDDAQAVLALCKLMLSRGHLTPPETAALVGKLKGVRDAIGLGVAFERA